MRTINILTIHKEPNYGAILQAFALYKAIEISGYAPRIIDLSIKYRKLPYQLKYKILLPIYQWIKGYRHCFNTAKKFSERHCPNQTQTFYTIEELRKYDWNKDDVYIIGSDQVWNPDITGKLCDAFFLRFLKDDAKSRYSYASSFGYINEKNKEKIEQETDALEKFKKIAVREKFGADYLKTKRIDATEVVDPTLLLDRHTYINLIKEPIEPKEEILLLTLQDSMGMNEYAKKMSQKTGLPIKKRYGYLQPDRKKNKRFINVEEWLKEIAESRYIITDSFHATVFSIIFEKDFYVFISEDSKKYRIANLLENTGIEGRIITDTNDTKLRTPIDYKIVKNKLESYKQSSLEYLRGTLNE